MQATWSNTNSEENASTTFKDTRYNPIDLLTLIASVEFMHESDCDSDSFTNEQRVEFLSNLIVEHEILINKHMKDHDIF